MGSDTWPGSGGSGAVTTSVIIPPGSGVASISIPVDPLGGDVEWSLDAVLPASSNWLFWAQPNGQQAAINLQGMSLSGAAAGAVANNSNYSGVTAWEIGTLASLSTSGNFLVMRGTLSPTIGRRRKMFGWFQLFVNGSQSQGGTFFHVDTDITTPYTSLVLSMTSSDAPPPVGASIDFQPGTILTYASKGYSI